MFTLSDLPGAANTPNFMVLRKGGEKFVLIGYVRLSQIKLTLLSGIPSVDVGKSCKMFP